MPGHMPDKVLLLPKKALLLSQLTLNESDIKQAKLAHDISATDPESTQTKSAHVVLQGSWIDSEGKTIPGFFKPITTTADEKNDYPILLAKYDVAISVLMRVWLGETAAEDRLVFDDQGQIVGTFSRKLPDYKPMGSGERPCTADEKEPELVNPKLIKTLIEHNVARLLTAEWAIGNIDVHPYNISIKGVNGEGCVLDYDECMARYTLIIKGGEGFLKWLEEKAVNSPQRLAKEDLDTFPILSEGNERKHWPAQRTPGTKIPLIPGKEFQSFQKFMDLAAISDEPIEIAPGEKISFQEQMFKSLLTMLLTYDPDMLKARLYDYLGDLPLNFMTLPDARKEALCASYPRLFTSKTDKGLFVEHMLKVFQEQYNELYRVVVVYPGYKPPDGVVAPPVVSFLNFLHAIPSARRKTMAWAEAQNALKLFSPPAQFNLEKIDYRYAKIWRDAHVIPFGLIWKKLLNLVVNITNDLRKNPGLALPEPSFKIGDDITEMAQVITPLLDLLQSLDVSVDSDPASPLTQGLHSLINFLIELTKASIRYFDYDGEILTPAVNGAYCQELLKLLAEYQDKICTNLKSTLVWDKRFAQQVQNLELFRLSLQLQLHELDDDVELTVPASVRLKPYQERLDRPHTNPEVVDTFVKAFFAWADKTPKDVLNAYISEVMQKKYEPQPLVKFKVPSFLAGLFSFFVNADGEIKLSNPMTSRHRSEDVAAHLKDVGDKDEVRGGDILAYILITGKDYPTSLNYNLIKYLLPLVLEWRMGAGGINHVNLLSLQRAESRDAVDYSCYTKAVINHVRTSDKYTHIYSPLSQLQLNNAMYVWVNGIERERLINIIETALYKYDPALKSDASYFAKAWGFFHTGARTLGSLLMGTPDPRGAEVLGYLQNKDLSNAGLLGSIFHKGGVEKEKVVAGLTVQKRSLNVWLFALIFEEMKKDLAADAEVMRLLDEDSKVTIYKVDPAQSLEYPGFSSFKLCANKYCTEIKTLARQQSQVMVDESQDVEALPMAASI